ncbi:MAG: PEP-CTERM sorting domain-containing protein [Chthoniobacterales bacterium]
MSIRSFWIFLLAVLTVTSSTSSFAVVISSGNGSGNTNAPSGPNGDLGWNYVGMVNGASGVYLGAYGGANWVLTANHVGFGNFTLNGTTYSAINGSGRQIGSIDLYAYQITVGQGTGLSLLSNLTLAGTSPATGETLTMIGNGKNRATSETYWRLTGTIPYTWNEIPRFFSNEYDPSGYKQLSSSSKRWGSNQADEVVTVNSTSMIQTTFNESDQSGTANEAQGAIGDSGGGVFATNNGSYQLAGIINSVGTFRYYGQPDNTAVFGNVTYSIDVASYRSAILNSVPEPGEFWLLILGGVFLAWVFLRAKKQSHLI